MHQLREIKENLDFWTIGLKRKGADVNLDQLVTEYDEYLVLNKEVEELRAQKNEAARNKDIEAGTKVSEKLKSLETRLRESEASLERKALEIPNIPDESVPDGGEEDFQILDSWGEFPQLTSALDHIQLGEKLNIIDIERGVKTSGARFYYLKNEAVELEFALVRWIFDTLKAKGFETLLGPQLVNEKTMQAGGYLGQAADEVYKTQDDLYLIGTAEQSILGYHQDEIIEVPKRYCAFSTCFRREAGSYGKDVKGIIRTHQFDKIEMFSFMDPEFSGSEHEFLVAIEEEILRELQIPYQKILIAAGDLGMSASKKYDLESWIPSQGKYRETHSCSNCTDWQARRANIRFKKGEENQFVHTLNGTAVAVGRLLVAILENHQQADGSVKVPDVLHKYLSFTTIDPK